MTARDLRFPDRNARSPDHVAKAAPTRPCQGPRVAAIRKAFIMHVEPTAHDEYRRRHDALWPELAAVLREHGVGSYSIFLDERRNLLFAYVELESLERWNAIADTPVCRRWWAHMRDLMATNPDDSPLSEDLTEVFHLSSGS
jgi:L-rhamnose mutarotase